MSRIYIPSAGPGSWAAFLVKPDLHWEVGYSARTMAHSWEAADGLPPEIAQLFSSLGQAELLLALPEHKTALPGGRRGSQSDVFALVRAGADVIACTIEGKVDEPFGPTLGEWMAGASEGKRERIGFIKAVLGLPDELPASVRYQLLHRSASAAVEAERFGASAAGMIVHSFSPRARWFEDYQAFTHLMGSPVQANQLGRSKLPNGKTLHLGWATGDQRFRSL